MHSTTKHRRHEPFISVELQDFMQSIPPSVITTSSEKEGFSVKDKTSGAPGLISPKIPTALPMI
jgi:hypothetical protein